MLGTSPYASVTGCCTWAHACGRSASTKALASSTSPKDRDRPQEHMFCPSKDRPWTGSRRCSAPCLQVFDGQQVHTSTSSNLPPSVHVEAQPNALRLQKTSRKHPNPLQYIMRKWLPRTNMSQQMTQRFFDETQWQTVLNNRKFPIKKQSSHSENRKTAKNMLKSVTAIFPPQMFCNLFLTLVSLSFWHPNQFALKRGPLCAQSAGDSPWNPKENHCFWSHWRLQSWEMLKLYTKKHYKTDLPGLHVVWFRRRS